MPEKSQYKSLIFNIIKNFGVVSLNASIFAIGMMGSTMLWLMVASGYHYFIDYCALLAGFVLTFKTSLKMFKIARYPKNDLQDAPIISWETQWEFLRAIIIGSLIIIPIKICANIIFGAAFT